MKSVVVCVAPGSGVEHDAGDERRPEGFAELAEAGEVVAGGAGRGLDLEPDDASVVGLENEVDFLVIASAPVTVADDVSVQLASLRISRRRRSPGRDRTR